MKRCIISAIAIILLVLSACGSDDNAENNDESAEADALTPLKVEILTEQEVEAGEVTLSAHVTHGNNNVNEADEVEFEVWQEGSKEQSEMITGSFTEEGVYEASYTFEDDGIYYMIAHVTALDQHTMPQQPIAVGNADLSEASNSNTEDGHNDH
ncbi:hypothetical protein ABID56_002208 [Alkalibacillus flavidus]|uniref:YtkA-like domain-containing protein n=1 Tax=Alkalibacillus flavidus TaxID=546021 RepID=A0ABV2KWX1_9BACI